MLLRHTPKEIKPREALNINPAKTCQPVGAMYASLGIHQCLPHSHGSQGCCAYHRSALSRHYKEPVMAATSSFTEGTSVFGGQANLLEALQNIFSIYNPEVVAIHTTCLSETIGDDIPQILGKAQAEGKIPKGKAVIHANTPSYVGSHVYGFANMTEAMASYFAQTSKNRKNQLNLVPGWVEPSDMRELKRMTAEMGIKTIMFPDTSGVLDAPQTGKHIFYPKGGVTLDALRDTGNSFATLALGELASGPAARLLDTRHKVKCEILGLPIGLKGTDRFVDTLRQMAGVIVPDSLNEERGMLLDMMSDMQQYFYNKKVALFGDPDQMVALSEFLVTLGMKPVHVVTGTSSKFFEKEMETLFTENQIKGTAQVSDIFTLHQLIKNEPVDLIIGNTYGKYVARDEDIPLIRFGFPILDRVGHSYFPTVGYRGAMSLMEKILSALMDRQDRDAPEEQFELVM